MLVLPDFANGMSAVEETFDVQLLPGVRFPDVVGFQNEDIRNMFVIPPTAASSTAARTPLPSWPPVCRRVVPPEIAKQLGRHPHTVRAIVNGFAARDTEAFYPDAPAPFWTTTARRP